MDESAQEEPDILEDVDEFLQKIESKYSTVCDVIPKNETEEQLLILSEEFGTLGLPAVDLKQPTQQLLQQIISNSLLLIHLHRKTLSQITDIDICSKYKDIKNHDLLKAIVELKNKLKQADYQNLKLETNIIKLNDECVELKKTVSAHREETDKMKRYFKSKQNELIHHINSLKNENLRLKEICGKDVDKYFTKEDKFLKVLKKYKENEEKYKVSLQKLEDNNSQIMNEILNLKEELALAYSKKD